MEACFHLLLAGRCVLFDNFLWIDIQLCVVSPPGGWDWEATIISSHKLPEVISRLSKIEGHIRGIKKMAEEGRSCEELLLQVSAVKSAVNAVGRVILEDYLEDCVVDGIRRQTDEDVLERMKKALEKFI